MLCGVNNPSYDAETGTITVEVPDASIGGFKYELSQYQAAQTLSMPNDDVLANLDKQSSAQMMVTGYCSSIIDDEYTIKSGEFTSYSSNWYVSTRVAGVEIQQAKTANVENMMMGQSTNKVLADMLSLIIDLITWADSHTHSVTTVISPVGPCTGATGTTITPAPSDSTVSKDLTYIKSNKNLAITGTYSKK